MYIFTIIAQYFIKYLRLFFSRGVFENFWRHCHFRSRAANFDLCSAFMAIEQWGIFNVPHLLWHEPTFIMVISVDPWLSHVVECLAIELSLCFNYLGMSRPGIEPWSPACEANALVLPLHHSSGYIDHEVVFHLPSVFMRAWNSKVGLKEQIR